MSNVERDALIDAAAAVITKHIKHYIALNGGTSKARAAGLLNTNQQKVAYFVRNMASEIRDEMAGVAYDAATAESKAEAEAAPMSLLSNDVFCFVCGGTNGVHSDSCEHNPNKIGRKFIHP